MVRCVDQLEASVQQPSVINAHSTTPSAGWPAACLMDIREFISAAAHDLHALSGGVVPRHRPLTSLLLLVK